MIVFCHTRLTRFSCAVAIKRSHLKFNDTHFDVHIPFSKTDPSGEGQSVILPSKPGRFNPHRLMCLFLQVMPQEDNYLFAPLK